MVTARPRPKHRVSEELPDDLVEFLAEVAELIEAGDDATKIPSDDLLQARRAYGGLREAGGDRFAFVYFPEASARPNRPRPRWELELTRAQLELVSDGSLASLPFWACSDSDCGHRFWTADAPCSDCDRHRRE